jgi:hypothetical protein
MNIPVLTRALLSTVLTVWTFSGAYALESGKTRVSSELGFKTLKDLSTSVSLAEAANSTFRVEIVSEDSPRDVKIFDLASDEFKDFESKINSMPSEQISQPEKVTVIKQIERCKRDHLESKCPLFLTFERATAFLAGGDGSYLVTNAHVVDHYLKLKAASDNKTIVELLKEPQWVPLFLFDQDGKLVFDPYENPPAVIHYGTPSALALLSGTGWYAEDSDYVVIKLPFSIGKPLKIAASKIKGETLYRLGYSSCTGCAKAPNKTDPELNRDRKPHSNSNGQDLYWTAGKDLGLTETTHFLGLPPNYFELGHKANWVFFSADSQVGMSGGPILNKNGEVIGVFAGSKAKTKKDGTMTVISRGVRPPEFDKK